MGERNTEAIIVVTPLKTSSAPFPLHGVRLDSVDGFQAHFIEFTLLGHTFDGKSARISILDPFYVEIEPSAIVANIGVRQAIAAHIASKMLIVRI